MTKIAFYSFDPDTMEEVPIRVVETDDKKTIEYLDGWSNGYILSRIVDEKNRNPDDTGVPGS